MIDWNRGETSRETWLLNVPGLKSFARSWPEGLDDPDDSSISPAAETPLRSWGRLLKSQVLFCETATHVKTTNCQVCTRTLPWIISCKGCASVKRSGFPNTLSWMGNTEIAPYRKERAFAEGFGNKMNVVLIRIFYRKHWLFMKNSVHSKCLKAIGFFSSW